MPPANIGKPRSAAGPRHTSACTARRYPAELVQYMRGHGRTKVLFGTNYPMITPKQALKNLQDLDLDEETPASSCTRT